MPRPKRITLLIALFIALLAPHTTIEQVPAKPVAEASELEYTVFSTYIKSAFTGAKGEDRIGNRVANIVIANRTRSDRGDTHMQDDSDKPLSWEKVSEYLWKEAPTLEKQTIEKLREVRNQSVLLRASFHLPVAYKLVDAKEVEEIFKKGGWWTDFYKKYPGSQGFLVLSRIGFSADGNQALFYATNSCGGKCGTGTYVVMRRSETGWRLVKEILIGVS
jgi:hypothetical protein